MRVLLQLMCLAIGLAQFADGRFGDGRVGDRLAIGERWVPSLKHDTLHSQTMHMILAP